MLAPSFFITEGRLGLRDDRCVRREVVVCVTIGVVGGVYVGRWWSASHRRPGGGGGWVVLRETVWLCPRLPGPRSVYRCIGVLAVERVWS